MNAHALDRYITGNWGEDQLGPDVPESAYCPACIDADCILGCKTCGGTGIDPVKAAESEAQAQAEADAEYEAWISRHADAIDATYERWGAR